MLCFLIVLRRTVTSDTQVLTCGAGEEFFMLNVDRLYSRDLFFLCFLQFKGEVVHEHLLHYESVLRERLIPKPNKPADKVEVNMCVYV